MERLKKITFNIKKLIKKNPNVDAKVLARNLEVLGELQKSGIKIGPNYNLDSPFSRPSVPNSKTGPIGSSFQPA